MKTSCGGEFNSNPHYHYEQNFCGVTETFEKKFIKTQEEILREFEKDTQADWIAGSLPDGWYSKIKADTLLEKNVIAQKILLLFRAAIKHLKPYGVNKGKRGYKQNKHDLENKRIKEASVHLTKGLRHFGVLPETNSIRIKKLKVKGQYLKRGYLINERGQNPTLEKLFLKLFKKRNSFSYEYNNNGVLAETAHGLFLTKNINSEYISKFYWGDAKVGYLTSEYATLPKHISPIVKFKNTYENIEEFKTDFFEKTGIKLDEIIEAGINPGISHPNKQFEPTTKEALIIEYLQTILRENGLHHMDLHNFNAIIGSTKEGKPIVKIVDIGGIVEN